MPAADIAVADEKNPPLRIEAGGSDTHCHAPGEREIDMQKAQGRPDMKGPLFFIHHRSVSARHRAGCV
ncbi:hypothetical protein RHECNPAF_156007 [Rhizobium etli CNPAF512]|nr:hypothetical protein RHECNPAF_156007 [Rhizobium etli CNPAF512]